jgi:hypothetical protein
MEITTREPLPTPHWVGFGCVRASVWNLCTTYTPSGAVKEVILRVTERAQKEVIARVGLGFGRCCP